MATIQDVARLSNVSVSSVSNVLNGRTERLNPATFERVQASGAEVLQEPVSQPWGARDCAFRDPSGNLVRIAQA